MAMPTYARRADQALPNPRAAYTKETQRQQGAGSVTPMSPGGLATTRGPTKSTAWSPLSGGDP